MTRNSKFIHQRKMPVNGISFMHNEQ